MMITGRQLTRLLGLAGLAGFVLASGITPAAAQPPAPEIVTWEQSTAHQWAEDERSTTGISASAWAFSRGGGLGPFRLDVNVVATPLDGDGDGDVDLAVEFSAEYGTRRGYLFVNDGAGTFEMRTAGDFSGLHSGRAAAQATSDLDGDGDSDLVAGYSNYGDGWPNAVYLNVGAGMFARLTEGDFDDPYEETRALAVFDADGDGDSDVAAGNWLARNGLYLNDGAGRLWRSESGDFGDHIDRTYALAAADFDGDGDLDLAEGNDGSPSALYFNDGNGVFSHIDSGGFTGEARYTRSLAAADYDGDGDVDLAEGIAYGSNKLYLNAGGGNQIESASCEFGEPSWQAAAMVAFDADVDGDADLAVANVGVPADLYLNDGIGCFSRSQDIQPEAQSRWNTSVVAFDANGDGALDLAVGAALFLNVGQRPAFVDLAFAGFDAANAGDLSGVNASADFRVFDANGDGGQDVLADYWYTGRNALYLHDGYSSYQLREAGELDDFPSWSSVAFDAEGDGDTDVATSGPNLLFLNDGSGVFTRGVPDDFVAARSYADLAAFDADRDGDLDLAGASTSPYHPSALFLNDGGGTFVGAGTLGSSSQLTRDFVQLDADGDGDTDLVELYPEWPATICRLMLNDGSGYFATGASLPCRGYGTIYSIEESDLDLDGDIDLIYDYRRWPSRDFDLLLNDGAGHFALVEGFERGLPFTPGGFAAFDVEGDGDDDVVKPNGVYLNDGAGYFSSGESGACLTLEDGEPTAVMDATLDGLPDVLVAPDAYQLPQVLCTNRGRHPEGTVTTDRIFPDMLYPGMGRLVRWQSLTVDQLTPGGSAITYDVLDGLTSQPIPGFYHVQPNASGQIDLQGIDAAAYPILKLRAKLMQGGGGETPQLRRWELAFQLQYEPTAVGLQGFDAMAGAQEAIGAPWLVVIAGSAALVLGYRARTSRFGRRA